MNRAVRALTVAAAIATLLVTNALPVAALTVKGDGYYSRWSLGASNPFRGIAIVDKVVGHSARLNALLVGLEAGEEYSIVGRSIGCNGTPSPANRLFGVNKMSDSSGVFAVSRNIFLGDVEPTESISFFRTEDATPFSCVSASAFEVATGDLTGDGAAGIVDGTSNTMMGLVERRPNGRARVSIVVDPQDPSGDIYVVSLANKACGQTPTKTIKIQLDGAGYSVHDIHMNQGSLNALRSIRIRNVNEGVNMGCAPLSVLIALLLP